MKGATRPAGATRPRSAEVRAGDGRSHQLRDPHPGFLGTFETMAQPGEKAPPEPNAQASKWDALSRAEKAIAIVAAVLALPAAVITAWHAVFGNDPEATK